MSTATHQYRLKEAAKYAGYPKGAISFMHFLMHLQILSRQRDAMPGYEDYFVVVEYPNVRKNLTDKKVFVTQKGVDELKQLLAKKPNNAGI